MKKSETFKITLHAGKDFRNIPMRAEFSGKPGSRKELMIRFDGALLASAESNSPRRFRPIDPLFWLAFVAFPDAPASVSAVVECEFA